MVRLDEIARVVGGATPSSTVPEYWDGDILWVTPADLGQLGGRFISDTGRKVTEVGLRNCAAEILPPDSVLFSSRAPIGHVAINLKPMATNQGLKSFVPDRRRLEPGFLYWWLRANRKEMQHLGNGATFKEVSKAVVSRVEIALPPLDEQRRIVAILDQADEIRMSRGFAIRRLTKLAEAVFFETFGDPIYNDKGWPVHEIAGFVRGFEGGKSLVADDADNIEALYRVLKVSAIGQGGYDYRESKALPNNYVPPQAHFVRGGDLLISRANTSELVGRVAFVKSTPDNIILPDKIWRFVWRDPDSVDPRFVEAMFGHRSMRGALRQLASGTSGSMKNISQEKLYALPVIDPPIALQRTFAARVREIDALRSLQRRQFLRMETLLFSLQHGMLSVELGAAEDRAEPEAV